MANTNLRHPLIVILTIVTFLVLAVIAAVDYSGSEVGAKKAESSVLYQTGALSFQAGKNFWGFLNDPWPKISLKESGATGSQSLEQYVSIENDGQRWRLILQNDRKVILDKSWPRLFKRK